METKKILLFVYFIIPIYLLFSPVDLRIGSPEALLASRIINEFQNIVALFMVGIGILHLTNKLK